ncbi:hypothetical protein MKX01_016552 [Papaver californicum]|nr:hypothetical protein MKX01_016552 [Papaver californicum]
MDIEQWNQVIQGEIPIEQIYVAVGLWYLHFLKSDTTVPAGLSGNGSARQGTVTSMDPSEGNFPVRVVDVPGHSRLRPKLDEYLPQASGLIFVVDALDFLPNCRAAAEVSGLIMCNKTDKVNAHTKEFIKKQLEKEIDKLQYGIGVAAETFTLSRCHYKVSVGESSGFVGDISQVENFTREHVL